MNLFECQATCLGAGGLLAGGVVGRAHGGPAGGALGAAIGFGVGVGVAYGLSSASDAFGIWLERTLRRRKLRPRFPGYDSPEKEAAWRELRASLRPADVVRGHVVAAVEYGVFLDLGRGFPGRLEARQMKGREPGGPFPPMGETVEARVLHLASDDREVVLTQSDSLPVSPAASSPDQGMKPS